MWSSRYYCRYVTVGILVARLPALFLKLRCFFFDFWLRKRERHFFSVLFFLFLGGGGGGLSHTLLSLITCGVITLKPSATNPSTPLIKETVALLRSTLLLPANQTKHKITLNWYLQFLVVLFCVTFGLILLCDWLAPHVTPFTTNHTQRACVWATKGWFSLATESESES